ncbi:MAG: hypothetical protein QM784_27480 [Polyangiaceae bacterium]
MKVPAFATDQLSDVARTMASLPQGGATDRLPLDLDRSNSGDSPHLRVAQPATPHSDLELMTA